MRDLIVAADSLRVQQTLNLRGDATDALKVVAAEAQDGSPWPGTGSGGTGDCRWRPLRCRP